MNVATVTKVLVTGHSPSPLSFIVAFYRLGCEELLLPVPRALRMVVLFPLSASPLFS